MKVYGTVRVAQIIELEVDDKFHQLDGYHDISLDKRIDLEIELENLIKEKGIKAFGIEYTDDVEIVSIEEDGTGEYLVEN